MAHFSSHKPLSNRKSAQRCDFLWRLKTVKSTLFRVLYFPTSYFTDSEWESDFVDSWKEHIFPKWNLNSKLRILILKPEKCFLIPVQKKNPSGYYPREALKPVLDLVKQNIATALKSRVLCFYVFTNLMLALCVHFHHLPHSFPFFHLVIFTCMQCSRSVW